MNTLRNTSRNTLFALALICASGVAASAQAQCGLTKLRPSDIATADFFGGALSITHEPGGVPVCAMGMVADDNANGLNAGSVRFGVLGAGGWAVSSALTLTALGGQQSDAFGASVSSDYPALAVGAVGANSSRGAVYFYRRAGSGWNLDNRVDGPTGVGTGFAHFGQSVGVSGDWAIIGAPYLSWPIGNSPNGGAGAVYFYQRQQNGLWVQEQLEKDADGSNVEVGAHMGWSVAIAGDLAVAGMPGSRAPDYTTPASNHGAIHIYRKSIFDAWLPETASVYGYADPGVQDNDQFGAAVSTDGVYIAVGAPQDDLEDGEVAGAQAKQNSGCVYMLRRAGNQWVSDGKVFAPAPSDGAAFGGSVVVKGGRLAVGASGSKRAYVYHRAAGAAGGWVLDAEITDPDGPDGFGGAVAFDGSFILVGDVNDNENLLVDSGAVYAGAPAIFSGDRCDQPLVISSETTAGCTTFASVDMKAPCDNSGGGSPDVWYAWTPTCTGNAIIDTIGSSFDTILSVHSACPDFSGQVSNTHTITCNDDASGFGHDSLVTLDYAAGTTYLIRVGGYNGAKGDFQLRINQWQSPTNDSCASPLTVSSGSTYTFSTCKATTDAGIIQGCVSNAVADVWFRFVAPVTGTLSLDTCGSNYDTTLALYTGGACPTMGNGSALAACNDDAPAGSPCPGGFTSATSTSILGGFPYLIRVAGYASTFPRGNGVLHVRFAANCPCDWNLSGVVTVQDIFDFLINYFAGNADFNHNGQTSVQDIFDFLNCYFAGCI